MILPSGSSCSKLQNVRLRRRHQLPDQAVPCCPSYIDRASRPVGRPTTEGECAFSHASKDDRFEGAYGAMVGAERECLFRPEEKIRLIGRLSAILLKAKRCGL